MYQCFHCLEYTLCWDSDFDFEDYGYVGEGIIHVLHCNNCGAIVEYKIEISEENENEDRI